MTISAFEQLKMGIGPSNSHTMGPMTACLRFVADIDHVTLHVRARRIRVELFESPAGTTRGFGSAEFAKVGHLIADVIDDLAVGGGEVNGEAEAGVRDAIRALCARFPIYMDLAGGSHHGR